MKKTFGRFVALWLCLVSSVATAQQVGFKVAKDRMTVTFRGFAFSK